MLHLLAVHERQLGFIGLEKNLIKKDILGFLQSDENIAILNKEKLNGQNKDSNFSNDLPSWSQFNFDDIKCSKLIKEFKE